MKKINILVNRRIAEVLQSLVEQGTYKDLNQAFRDVLKKGIQELGGEWSLDLYFKWGLMAMGAMEVKCENTEEKVKIPLKMRPKIKKLILDSFESMKEKYSDVDEFTSYLILKGIWGLSRFYDRKRNKITVEKIFEVGLFRTWVVPLDREIAEKLLKKERRRNLERWAKHHAQYGETIGGAHVSAELAEKIVKKGGAPFYRKKNGAYTVNIINPKYDREVIACEGKSKAGYHGYYKEAEIHPLPKYGGNFILMKEKNDDQYKYGICYTCRGKNFVVYKWDHYYGKFECDIYIVPQVAKKYGLWNK